MNRTKAHSNQTIAHPKPRIRHNILPSEMDGRVRLDLYLLNMRPSGGKKVPGSSPPA